MKKTYIKPESQLHIIQASSFMVGSVLGFSSTSVNSDGGILPASTRKRCDIAYEEDFEEDL